jgi:hypothetical protein
MPVPTPGFWSTVRPKAAGSGNRLAGKWPSWFGDFPRKPPFIGSNCCFGRPKASTPNSHGRSCSCWFKGFTRNFSLLGPLNQPLNQSYERCSPQFAGCASKNHPIGNLPPVIMTWVCLRLVFLIPRGNPFGESIGNMFFFVEALWANLRWAQPLMSTSVDCGIGWTRQEASPWDVGRRVVEPSGRSKNG